MQDTRGSSNWTAFVNNLDVSVLAHPNSWTDQIYRIVVISIAFFANCLVLTIILSSRQLRYPRHVYWAAACVLNIFCMINLVIEMVALVTENPTVCKIFVGLAGTAYSSLLLCLAVTATDRYLSIAHSDWYGRVMTVRLAVILTAGCYLVSVVTVSSPYWIGLRALDSCSVNMFHILCVMIWNLTLGVACVLLHVAIFLTCRRIILRKQQCQDHSTSGNLVALTTLHSHDDGYASTSRFEYRWSSSLSKSKTRGYSYFLCFYPVFTTE